ncbi:hypothetical protein K8I85_18440, partial [bacterium]|nr:hypothetical protein [bacterium]
MTVPALPGPEPEERAAAGKPRHVLVRGLAFLLLAASLAGASVPHAAERDADADRAGYGPSHW